MYIRLCRLVEWIVRALKLACHRAKCITCLLIHSGDGSLVVLACHFGSRIHGSTWPDRGLRSEFLFVVFVFFFLLLVMAAAGALASCASDAELTLEQVATMLSGIIGKTVPEIQAAGVVDMMLHASELMDMLKNAPALSSLAKETKDASKRRKLEATSAAMSEPLAGEPGAASSGENPLDQPKAVDMGALRRS